VSPSLELQQQIYSNDGGWRGLLGAGEKCIAYLSLVQWKLPSLAQISCEFVDERLATHQA
jgi:hypothetical protein